MNTIYELCGIRKADDSGLCDNCRRAKSVQRIDRRRLPIFYKLILKLPLVERLESASGIFWALIVPPFVFLVIPMSLYLLWVFPFLINLVLTGIVPTSLFVLFVKLSLERFINFWNVSIAHPSLKWDVEETVKGYVSLLKEQRKKETQE